MMNKARPGLWRVGEGWDIHALRAGRRLVLGGVEIPHSHGLFGHSDADALCHAITDALFGACALGDIGHHFPDTDAQYRGADSLALLAEAARRVKRAGWEIGNVDCDRDRAGAEAGAAHPGDAPAHRAGARRRASIRSASRRRRPKGWARSASAKRWRRAPSAWSGAVRRACRTSQSGAGDGERVLAVRLAWAPRSRAIERPERVGSGQASPSVPLPSARSC